VGYNIVGGETIATEWIGTGVVSLGLGQANAINDLDQVVGNSQGHATEWSNGSVIDLGGLPGSTSSIAYSINDSGQVVGECLFANGSGIATEWSGGTIINLGSLLESLNSTAYDINNTGQVVGFNEFPAAPEPSTWAMILLGFAGASFIGWRGRSVPLAAT
jgi:probable HAF family extracellular repeat protein